MEVGLCEEMPTYPGGLGVLAGDTLRAAADAGLPMVAMTLLHRQGYLMFDRLLSSGIRICPTRPERAERSGNEG